MRLSYLLARNGIFVMLLERHEDFSREFRGEACELTTLTTCLQLERIDE